MTKYYRFVSGTMGVFEAVGTVCDLGTPAPAADWLRSIGSSYPEGNAWFTQSGLARYLDSGLLERQRLALAHEGAQIAVIIGERPDPILYEDELQIVCRPKEIDVISKQTLDVFLRNHDRHARHRAA